MSEKSRSRSSSGPLVCPSCGQEHGPDERFCQACGMPLVYAGADEAEAPRTPADEWRRKVRPDYTRGELVRVAGGRNQAEAELIQGLLLEDGVPSILRRSAGFDVPDFLAAGPRDVLVPESGAEAARRTLQLADLAPAEGDERPFGSRALRILAGVLVVGFVGLLLAWVLFQVSS
ncbi:MAG: zinc-ribbon domain-containing protein [Actinomycetota bacterium]|nr:zinc-ribbon domain-containing protein [Actinomycetota bacterium]